MEARVQEGHRPRVPIPDFRGRSGRGWKWGQEARLFIPNPPGKLAAANLVSTRGEANFPTCQLGENKRECQLPEGGGRYFGLLTAPEIGTP